MGGGGSPGRSFLTALNDRQQHLGRKPFSKTHVYSWLLGGEALARGITCSTVTEAVEAGYALRKQFEGSTVPQAVAAVQADVDVGKHRRKTNPTAPEGCTWCAVPLATVDTFEALEGRLERVAERRHLELPGDSPERLAAVINAVSALEVAHDREIVDALEVALSAEKIQGGMKTAQVEAGKNRFNRRQSMAMILSMEAGKTGLCLQKLNGAGQECARMLIAEESWAPSNEEQAQDRLWRIGQTRDVVVTNMTVPGTLDTGIWNLREQKRRVVNAVTDGTELDEERLQTISFLTQYIMGH